MCDATFYYVLSAFGCLGVLVWVTIVGVVGFACITDLLVGCFVSLFCFVFSLLLCVWVLSSSVGTALETERGSTTGKKSWKSGGDFVCFVSRH